MSLASAVSDAREDLSAGAALADVLMTVQAQTGVDLGAYRASTVQRRLQGRMRQMQTQRYGDYLERLQADAEEAGRLLSYVRVKVSRFFRNASVFEALRRVVLPDLQRRFQGQPLRCWSAGCSSGEEAYGLAILLAENLPPPDRLAARVEATDVDEQVLAAAVDGTYRSDALLELSPALTERYFVREPGRVGARYRVRADRVPRVRFSRHDLLLAEAPPAFVPFHLVCCRNVLIYLTLAAQERVQRLLAASLAPGGYLCLGEAEVLSRSVAGRFDLVDRSSRLYRLRSERAS
ncbi:MAG: protein-glutamate O-methyltransferase CheR [Chloroflexi bacterium]|nr:protein-glutamate O-methyltransferase CheR [Chloroflexota bacterium]